MKKKRLIVGVSGATGIPLAEELLRELRLFPEIEVHLIASRAARMTMTQEGTLTWEEFSALADVVEDNANVGAGPASGSFASLGMVIVPCSMKTVAGIVSGYSDTLLLRAADVTLKERRKLVLVARESPLGTVHLRNLYEASQLGAVVLPPMLSYYQHPESVEDLTCHVVRRILAQWDLEVPGRYEWQGMNEEKEGDER
ncbi:MAG: UbiX family flavin prenyltransferase [Lachnospiraceae bacterium]|nr:UbiX family flavin prenyltransferase [Lachnospiraceae bacterium]